MDCTDVQLRVESDLDWLLLMRKSLRTEVTRGSGWSHIQQDCCIKPRPSVCVLSGILKPSRTELLDFRSEIGAMLCSALKTFKRPPDTCAAAQTSLSASLLYPSVQFLHPSQWFYNLISCFSLHLFYLCTSIMSLSRSKRISSSNSVRSGGGGISRLSGFGPAPGGFSGVSMGSSSLYAGTNGCLQSPAAPLTPVSVNKSLLAPLNLDIDPSLYINRTHEKEQIKSLNNRFANFIDKVNRYYLFY